VSYGNVVMVSISCVTYVVMLRHCSQPDLLSFPTRRSSDLGKVTATVSGEDEYGNPYSANDDADFTVQTDLPEAEITITEPLFGEDRKITNPNSSHLQESCATVCK